MGNGGERGLSGGGPGGPRGGGGPGGGPAATPPPGGAGGPEEGDGPGEWPIRCPVRRGLQGDRPPAPVLPTGSPPRPANAFSISTTRPDRRWAKTSRYSIARVQPT